MRCHYLSDLHLESQSFDAPLPSADVLIIAGDLCHARCLDPARPDRYSIDQRSRVMRFVDRATRSFTHVLMVAGNHEPYDGVFEATPTLLRRHLPGVTVLDDDAVAIGGVHFFGSTLWTDFDGGSDTAMNAVRRRMGEYFFVKTCAGGSDGSLRRFRPEDALGAHAKAWAALSRALQAGLGKRTVVITHHAPSRLGLNPAFCGNGLDPAYASSLDDEIAAFEGVPVWIHGHTHMATRYRVGATAVATNALGFAAKGHGAHGFSVEAHFEIDDLR